MCLPFHIGCGFSKNCERGLTGFCLTANPGTAGAAYGFAGMGPYEGGQAELLRVPWADINCLLLPSDAKEKENDYVMLSDIFPTGWHAIELAGVRPGDSVVVYGCGPVGLLAAHSATLKSASKVLLVDRQANGLAFAESIGVIPVDDSKDSVVDRVLEETDGDGADCGCECVGYQAHDHEGHDAPNLTVNNLVASVKATGGIGVVGVFIPEDPGAEDKLAQEDKIEFDFRSFWFKGQRMATGQSNVKAYKRTLRDLIHAGKAKPSFWSAMSYRWPVRRRRTGISTTAMRAGQGHPQARRLNRSRTRRHRRPSETTPRLMRPSRRTSTPATATPSSNRSRPTPSTTTQHLASQPAGRGSRRSSAS